MLGTAIKHHQNKEFEQAEKIYRKLLEKNPPNPDVPYLYGMLLTQTGKLDESVQYYYQALKTGGNQVEIYHRLLEIYKYKNDIDKIIFCYSKLIELDPKNPQYYFNIGINFAQKGDIENTYKAYLNAVYLKPDFAEAHLNLGSLLQSVYNFKNAEKHLLKAIELNDSFCGAYVNLGNLYIDTCELKKVIEISEEGLKKHPGSQSLEFNISRAHFLMGNMDKAWEYFRLRRIINEKKELKNYLLDYQGSLDGKKVLVYWDCGYGDSLQFLRYVHMLKKQCAHIYLRIQAPLEPLVKTSGFDVELVPTDQDIQQLDYDLQINLTSLAYPYKIDDYSDKYIFADAAKIEEWKKKYFNTDSFKIGIVWLSHVNQYKKNIPDIRVFHDIAKMPGVQLYSLQQTKGKPMLDNLPPDFNIIHVGDEFKDFSDTAAVVENLDLVIAIDTALIHLAGAMGRTAWCLLPDIPNWRWFMQGDRVPWYDSVRLFRQTEPDNWGEVLQRVKHELDKLVLK